MPQPRSQKPCPLCGHPMHRQSHRCRMCWRKDWQKPENYRVKECLKCKKPFRAHKCHEERGQGKYCSRVCARSGSPTRKKMSPLVQCQTCGETFNKFKAEIRKNRGRLHFCSPECWYSHNQRDNHYLWAGGQSERMNPDAAKWRKAVLKRDRKRCRVCQAAKKLEAHHIHPFTTHPEIRWEVSNGIVLCHACHVKVRYHEMEYAEAFTLLAATPLVESK
jgi:hypothetical protein